MKLLVFGSTGRTGIPLVQQALEEGHEVRAFLRDPARMPIRHERLELVSGDVMNADDVSRAVQGVDVVLSALGHSKNTPRNLQSVAADNIVNAMKQHGVETLIAMTGAGVAGPQDQPKLFNHLIKFALKTISPAVLADSEHYAEKIKSSGLDWVIVRVPMLTEDPHTGQYRVGWVGVNTGPRIGRADVADFMLKQLRDTKFRKQMPVVSS